MKIRTKYYCEYCGKEFETEASCQAHEEAHALELEIIKKEYCYENESDRISYMHIFSYWWATVEKVKYNGSDCAP